MVGEGKEQEYPLRTCPQSLCTWMCAVGALTPGAHTSPLPSPKEVTGGCHSLSPQQRQELMK